MANEADDVLAKVEAGKSDDPDKLTDSEALGARHRRRFGYTDEGASENDSDILAKGRAPLKIDGGRKQQNVGSGRNEAFAHGVVGGIVKHS
jgi:hypothetical protein